MRINNIPSSYRKVKEILIMQPDRTLLSTLISSKYPCLELIFMVPKVFEPLKFDCSMFSLAFITKICQLLLLKIEWLTFRSLKGHWKIIP